MLGHCPARLLPRSPGGPRARDGAPSRLLQPHLPALRAQAPRAHPPCRLPQEPSLIYPSPGSTHCHLSLTTRDWEFLGGSAGGGGGGPEVEARSRRARRPHQSLCSVLKAVGATAGLSGGRSKSHNAPGGHRSGTPEQADPKEVPARPGEDAARHPVFSPTPAGPAPSSLGAETDSSAAARRCSSALLWEGAGEGVGGSMAGGILPDLLRGLKIKSQLQLLNK